jgi:hypothetical protein
VWTGGGDQSYLSSRATMELGTASTQSDGNSCPGRAQEDSYYASAPLAPAGLKLRVVLVSGKEPAHISPLLLLLNKCHSYLCAYSAPPHAGKRYRSNVRACNEYGILVWGAARAAQEKDEELLPRYPTYVVTALITRPSPSPPPSSASRSLCHCRCPAFA